MSIFYRYIRKTRNLLLLYPAGSNKQAVKENDDHQVVNYKHKVTVAAANVETEGRLGNFARGRFKHIGEIAISTT